MCQEASSKSAVKTVTCLNHSKETNALKTSIIIVWAIRTSNLQNGDQNIKKKWSEMTTWFLAKVMAKEGAIIVAYNRRQYWRDISKGNECHVYQCPSVIEKSAHIT